MQWHESESNFYRRSAPKSRFNDILFYSILTSIRCSLILILFLLKYRLTLRYLGEKKENEKVCSIFFSLILVDSNEMIIDVKSADWFRATNRRDSFHRSIPASEARARRCEPPPRVLIAKYECEETNVLGTTVQRRARCRGGRSSRHSCKSVCSKTARTEAVKLARTKMRNARRMGKRICKL